MRLGLACPRLMLLMCVTASTPRSGSNRDSAAQKWKQPIAQPSFRSSFPTNEDWLPLS